MKKFFLQIALGMLWAFSTNVQGQTWTAPTLTGSTLTTGTTYYVYNVGSNGYLNRGGNYKTQAVVTASPTANAAPATIIKWTATNTSGIIWTFQYNSAAANVASNFLFPANTADGSVFTDNVTSDTWNVVQTDATNKIYSIQIASTYAGYVSTQFLGTAASPEVNNTTNSTGGSGTFNPVRYNRIASTFTQWKFATQADLDLYNARVILDRYMNYAKSKGSIDLTSYISTYNAGVTATITSSAATLLTALGRTDVTASITNPSFETNSFTGWTNSGIFTLIANAQTAGWTKAGTYFSEKFITSLYGTNGSVTKGYLGTGTIIQTISGLSGGLYGLVVAGHAYQQTGANPLHTGAFITAGALSTEVSSGQDYNVDNVSVSNGTLAIGYSLQGTVQV
ncbi:MAG: hypothetical protein WCJ61_12465, partial [Paludibacter sp.]